MSGERHGDGEGDLHTEAIERRLTAALHEVVGGERAPDVLAAVLARRASGDRPAADHEFAASAPRRRAVVAAALVLLGTAVVVGTLWTARSQTDAGDRAAPRGATPGDSAPPQGPSPIRELTDPAAIAALPADLTAIAARNLDDAAVAALIARCPALTDLRIHASTASRRADDPETPVSISDAALAAIAGLDRLRRLELVGTDRVRGPGLRQLPALPLLEDLTLASFDLDDEALAVLPRLPSLRRLDLHLNHGFGERGVAAIATCPGLRTLVLRGCSPLTPEWLAALGRLTALEDLDLSGIGTTWRGAATEQLARARQPELQMLIEQAGRNGSRLGVAAIAGWPKLRRIALADGHELESSIGMVLRTRCPALQEVVLAHCPRVDDTTVAELLGLRHLRKLDLSGCAKVTETSGDLLLLARQLREVVFEECEWLTLASAERLLASGKRVANHRQEPGYDRALAALVERFAAALAQPSYAMVRELGKLAVLPPDLEYLELRGLGDEAAVLLARRPGLRGVQFIAEAKGAALTDVGLRILAGIATIEAIELLGARGITAKGIAELAALPSLRQVRIVGVDLDDDALVQLARCGALTELELSGVRTFGDRGIQALAGCRTLRRLSLRTCAQLTSPMIARLAPLVALESLDLDGIQGIDDAALLALAPLTALRELRLEGAAVTAHGMPAVATMAALRVLHLGECRGLSTAALAHLPAGITELQIGGCAGLDRDAGRLLRDRLPGLVQLDVHGNSWLDDAALAAVLQLPKLESLAIFDCTALTAASLPALRTAPALLRLDAMRLPWLSRAEAARLETERPGLVVRDRGW